MGCIRTGSDRRWPNGVIPYTIDENDFPANSPERDTIRNAIKRWEDSTNKRITFQPRNGEVRYVVFVDGRENGPCSSKVGMVPGSSGVPIPQFIYCDRSRPLVHEIGHAIGLWHEQSREDRNAFITVHLEHVQSDQVSNLDQHVDDGTVVGDYDYDSVMHYRRDTFAVQWRPAVPLPDQTSKDAPAIAVMHTTAGGEQLHLLHLGESSNKIWHSWTDDGKNWTKNQPIEGQTSKARPALAAFNGALHMVHLGNSSNDLWHSWTDDGENWTKNQRIKGQTSKATPALATFKGVLHMVHLGDSSNDLWHSTFDGEDWTENQRIKGQTSKATPALADFDGALHMVHLGDSSNDLWHSWTEDGENWTEKRIEGQTSKATPALAVFKGALHLAHIGNSSPTIWHSTFDGSEWTPTDRKDNNQSHMSPTLAAFNRELHSVHRGKSSKRIWRTVRDTSLRIFDVPKGVMSTPGETPEVISQGDIDAVNAMYP